MQHAPHSTPGDFDAPFEDAPARPPLSALILEPALHDTLFAVAALSSSGFHVTVAESFAEAKALLGSRRPTLLLTEIQLGDYNGLHLVMHARALQPEVASIVTARRRDPVLQTEADRLGATFLLKPTTESELLAAVTRTMLRAPHDTTPIRPPFERRLRDRRLRPMGTPAGVERRALERRIGLGRLTGSSPPAP